jgi:hypothetical protein
MKPVKPIKELLILLIILILNWLLAFILTKSITGASTIDINLHDTYFVFKLTWRQNILLPFLLWTMFVYIIRGAKFYFKNRLQNLIILFSVIWLNFSFLEYYKQASHTEADTSHSWTIYPPLSALSQHPSSIPTHDSPFVGVVQVLFIIQIILLAILVIITFITGKNWNTNKNVF